MEVRTNLRTIVSPSSLLHNLTPSDTISQPIFRLVIQPPQLDQCPDELRETLISERAPNTRHHLGDIIPLLGRCGISVGIRNERECRRDEARIGMRHEFFVTDLYVLTCREVLCIVQEGEDSMGGPGKFVSKRVISTFGCRETTTVA